MVCKEDVLSWFKDLDCYKRIDVMHDLLNICMPFELRFIGSCLEEFGKHTYQELRGLTLVANDVDKLAKDTVLTASLLDEAARNRAVLYLSLLSSRNCVSAEWMYKTLFRTEVLEDFVVKGNCKDEALQNVLLLLFTMGLHHPAFTFDQKSFFGRLIERLLEQKEHRNEVIPKIGNFCLPPGFPYQPPPPPPVISSHSELHVIPSNPSMVIGSSEGVQHPPPGLPIHTVHPPMDLIWQRPTLAGNICVPTEVPPFPAPSLSPLVSQPGSPPPSRANSPHRNYTLRPVTGIPMTHNLELQSNPSQINVDSTISTSSLLPKYIIKDDEPNHMQEDKLRDQKWMKPPNGLMSSYLREAPNFFCHQMQALKLEGENSLHCSTSSSNSSLNQSPPQTPTATIVTQHGPGRGEKPRLNGVPTFMAPPACESTPPPPPLSANVPYMNFPAPPPISIAMPNRCFISYRHPTYTPNDTFAPNDQQQPYTASPYLHFPFHISSITPTTAHRNMTCYNCGTSGHVGAECTSQTIDDITQKPYALEYTPMSDGGDK